MFCKKYVAECCECVGMMSKKRQRLDITLEQEVNTLLEEIIKVARQHGMKTNKSQLIERCVVNQVRVMVNEVWGVVC